MDAIAAFLHRKINKEAYIKLLEGWKNENKVMCEYDSIKLLIKVLYGLK